MVNWCHEQDISLMCVCYWTLWFFFHFVTFRKGSIVNGGQFWKISVWCFTYKIFLPVRKRCVKQWVRPKSCYMLSKFLQIYVIWRTCHWNLAMIYSLESIFQGGKDQDMYFKEKKFPLLKWILFSYSKVKIGTCIWYYTLWQCKGCSI